MTSCQEAMDNKGMRPLHLAAKKGHSEVVRLLRARGASESKDSFGWSPAMRTLERLLCMRLPPFLGRQVRRRQRCCSQQPGGLVLAYHQAGMPSAHAVSLGRCS